MRSLSYFFAQTTISQALGKISFPLYLMQFGVPQHFFFYPLNGSRIEFPTSSH